MFSILYLESLALGIGLGMWSLVFAKAPDPQQPPPLPEKVNPYPIVAGIDFAEGPIFDKHGNLYFVNYIRNGTIGRRTPDGTVSVWCETGGQANGLKVDSDGYIIAADYGGKRILRIHPNGKDIQGRGAGEQGRKRFCFSLPHSSSPHLLIDLYPNQPNT